MDNRYNEVFPLFDPINPEFFPGSRIIDIFTSWFSFYSFTKCNNKDLKTYIQQLDNLVLESSSTPFNALVITDASVKNNVAIFISHIHIHNKPVTKMLHQAMNVISTKAELFAIRYSINQATSHNKISKIIVVTDSLHAVRKIFNLLSHPFQKHSAAVLNELWVFFFCHLKNSIKFWECPSWCNWSLHKVVDVKTKLFYPILLFPSKTFWDFSKKQKCNDLVNRWKIIFQVLDLKSKHFLDLINSNENIIEPSYIKGGLWLKHFDYSNLLYARASKAITNHAITGEFRFFPREEFSCSYRLYPIEIRCYILHKYKRFNEYWNLRRNSISHFILFLELNSNAFAFSRPIT